MQTATYTKLKNGNWGVRVPSESARDGETVTVTKKSGDRKTETIAKVLWRGNGVSICALAQSSTPRYSSRSRECAECGEMIRSPNQRCWETGGTCFAD